VIEEEEKEEEEDEKLTFSTLHSIPTNPLPSPNPLTLQP